MPLPVCVCSASNRFQIDSVHLFCTVSHRITWHISSIKRVIYTRRVHLRRLSTRSHLVRAAMKTVLVQHYFAYIFRALISPDWARAMQHMHSHTHSLTHTSSRDEYFCIVFASMNLNMQNASTCICGQVQSDRDPRRSGVHLVQRKRKRKRFPPRCFFFVLENCAIASTLHAWENDGHIRSHYVSFQFTPTAISVSSRLQPNQMWCENKHPDSIPI